MITFEVDARPIPQGSLMPNRINGTVHYAKADRLYEWRAAIARACPVGVPAAGPYRVSITFRLVRPQSHRGARGILPRYADSMPISMPDLDKLVRGVLDALTGRVWDDDSQVVELHASKVYAEGRPGASIEIDRVGVGAWV